MIDIERFKAALTKGGIINLTEEQVLKLREQQDNLAEIIFAMWLEHINEHEVK